MISKLETEEINNILDIWLKASIRAHGFIAEEFWKSKIDAMRTIYIPSSETYVFKEKSIVNMDVVCSKATDFNAWIPLAREVEPLFGPMADEKDFREALKNAISLRTAFCIYSEPNEGNRNLIGGVVISKEANEIAWLAVSQQYRGKGYGRKLIEYAIGKLNPKENMFVQTFDKSVLEGKSARKLYLGVGFTDFKDGGLNPAGVPTVVMRLEALKK